MDEHAKPIDYEAMLYNRSAGSMKAHGILSIIFGAIGVVVGFFFTILVLLGMVADDSQYAHNESIIGLIVFEIMIFIFWIAPHLYLIVSGYYLVRAPKPSVAKTLIIMNLIVGVFWNLILLIFAIINLTQYMDYERGYHLHKKK